MKPLPDHEPSTCCNEAITIAPHAVNSQIVPEEEVAREELQTPLVSSFIMFPNPKQWLQVGRELCAIPQILIRLGIGESVMTLTIRSSASKSLIQEEITQLDIIQIHPITPSNKSDSKMQQSASNEASIQQQIHDEVAELVL